MINLQLFKTVEELYNRKGKPTGELIIDAVIEAICSTKTHRSEDIALWLNVDKRDLWHSIHMLTGMRLNDIILQWRVLQAKEKWDEKQARYNEHKELVKAKKKDATSCQKVRCDLQNIAIRPQKTEIVCLGS